MLTKWGFTKIVLDALKDGGITCTPDAISHRFAKLVKEVGLPHFRYHDLRHFYASYLHLKGIPDVYIERFGGWVQGSSAMKSIYRNVIDDELKRQSEMVVKAFSGDDVNTIVNISPEKH